MILDDELLSVRTGLVDLESRVSTNTLSHSDLASFVATFRTLATRLAAIIRKPHVLDPRLKPDLELAHYTSLEKAVAIASSGPGGMLRLYDSVHVNDPKEGIATSEGSAIMDEVQRCRSDVDTTPSTILRLTERFSTGYILSFVANTFVTEPGNDLGFWRSYGRDGRGCSFAFFPLLSGWPTELVAGLRRVTYSHESAPDYSNEILLLRDVYGKLSYRVGGNPTLASRLATTQELLDECFARRFLTKDSAYEMEGEVRFVAFPDGQESVVYHVVNGEIRHYLELPALKLETLFGSQTVIRVGPAVPHAADVVRSLSGIWAQKWRKSSVPHVRIERSLIPYRSSI